MILCNKDIMSRQKPSGVPRDHHNAQGHYSYMQHRQEPPHYNYKYGQHDINMHNNNSSFPAMTTDHAQTNQTHNRQQQVVAELAGISSSPQQQHLHQAPQIHHSHYPGDYEKKKAIQELEQNLNMVLSQRQQSQPQLQPDSQHSKHGLQQEQDLSDSRTSAESSFSLHQRRDRHRESSYSSTYQRDHERATDQAKMLAQYQHFFGSQAPSNPSNKTEEKRTDTNDSRSSISNSSSNSNSNSNKYDSKLLPHFPVSSSNTSLNDRSLSPMSRLFTLGSELKPLETVTSYTSPNKYQEGGYFGHPKRSSLPSSNDLVGLSDNDLMMNKLFHSELKMSRVVHSNKNRTNRKGSDRKNIFSTNNSVEESDVSDRFLI